MRRFAFCGNINELKKEYVDVVIIGSGIAGLYTALNLDDNVNCIILTKENTKVSSSWFAQGGVAAVTREVDNTELHIKDTLVAGAGHCDVEAVKTLVIEGPAEIRRLLLMGVPFDIDDDGELKSTMEGGHSINRILHCGGDATGKQLTEKLEYLCENKKNITMINEVFLTDILVKNNKTLGVIVFDGEYRVIMSPNIIICTGGIGQVYKYTTNPTVSTGDGVATANRAGANLSDMEFVQFHPTALALSDENGRYFLISEALRGEGAVLRNKNGERFMLGVHPLKELAPRDIVARAIFAEMKRTNEENVFLDITHRDRKFLQERFPTIFEECLKRGLDISKEYIPVTPVQHYFMGGLKTDMYGMTNIDGLYSVGETACTGVHGANRLASNSLLECLVFGRRCARQICEYKRKQGIIDLNKIYKSPELIKGDLDISGFKGIIKKTMSKVGGIIRNGKEMEKGIEKIREIKSALEKNQLTMDGIETLNMATTAESILDSAIKRTSSIGAHFRDDDNNGGI